MALARAQWMVLIVSAAVVTLAAAACGDDDGNGDGTPAASATAAAPTTAASPSPAASPTPAASATPDASAFRLTSEMFGDGETLPVDFTCNGANVSPPLAWENVPDGTQSFALIMDDPDAPGGDFVHWVLYDIPADLRALPEAVPAGETVPGIGTQGVNGANQPGFIGACPPSGEHRYQYKLYALDALLGLPPRTTKAGLLAAMEGHILAQAQLTGLYASDGG
ncbi:MAG TPA: YbhB/YbcL family Raf kinase inhibitor-like protein [Dehalococcoidia bacterium]|nr:YbhB/YbcL family Raf kinase inhibitor-like protein [Dehalococcoidia bacterium]